MSQLQPYHPMLWLRAPTYASSLPLAVRDRGHRTGTWSSGPTADQRGVQVTSQANTGSGKTQGMVSRTHKLVQAINPSELAQRMRDRRTARGLTIQQAAAEAGVSAATFSPVARGGHLPDFEHMLLLAQWVGVANVQLPVTNPEFTETATQKAVIHSSGETTLESIALHLRADENLDAEDVESLMEIIRTSYQIVLKLHQKWATHS